MHGVLTIVLINDQCVIKSVSSFLHKCVHFNCQCSKCNYTFVYHSVIAMYEIRKFIINPLHFTLQVQHYRKLKLEKS